MFRHSTIFSITVEDINSLPNIDHTKQDKEIFRLLYDDIHRELAAVRTTFHLDPTGALNRLDTLQLQLHNKLY